MNTRRPLRDLLLAAEALALLTVFRIALRVFPVQRILRAVARTSAAPPRQHPSAAPSLLHLERPPDPAQSLRTASRVRWAVEAVTRHAPARFVCFPQTLAGYTMLRRRGVPSTMVYGVTRSPQGTLLAHTWLMQGDRTVVGGEGSGGFTPVEFWS